MEGESLLPALSKAAQPRSKPIFWEFAANHAVRIENWKLVAERSRDWELYNLDEDRCETNDLASAQPTIVADLAKRYDRWSQRVGAKSHARCKRTKPSSQAQLFPLD